MQNTPVKRIRVFTIESPSALDVLADRTESQTLRAVCKLLGHDFASTTVRSEEEFRTALKHITSINEQSLPATERGAPLCIHIAAHGDKDGLALGGDDVGWEELAEALWSFFRDMGHYSGPLILVVSACCAEHQKITQQFGKNAVKKPFLRPPLYVLTTVSNDAGEVYWHDSVVAWSIFYHQIGAAVLTKRTDIQLILDKINLVGAGSLKYFRWDSSTRKYLPYTSKMKEHSRQPAPAQGEKRR